MTLNLHDAFISAVLFFSFGASLVAQSPDLTLPTPTLTTPASELPAPPATLTASPEAVVVEESEWFAAPVLLPTGTWNLQVDFIPTTFHLTDGPFGGFTEDPSLATRLTFGYEQPSGFGVRAQSWSMSEEIDSFLGNIKADATTLYLDAYQQQSLKGLELDLGGGLAGALMDFRSSRYSGAGVSLFGEGFYPFSCYMKTDFGLVGRARLALLLSIDDELMEGWGAAIDEFGWGLRLRHRFGREQDKYWTVDLMREVQHWGSTSDPFASDQVFQGTAIKFGIGW